eukprot:6311425-Alexandrium_andersonii.AAC.1
MSLVSFSWVGAGQSFLAPLRVVAGDWLVVFGVAEAGPGPSSGGTSEVCHSGVRGGRWQTHSMNH